MKSLDSVHDDCARRAALQGGFGQAVGMRVIPIDTRRFIKRESEIVLKGFARIDDGVYHLILAAGR